MGRGVVSGWPAPAGEIAIFEPSEEPIDFIAPGNYSVHTSEEALRQGEAEIRRIGREFRANGTLRR